MLSGIPLGRILPLPSYAGHEMYDPVAEDSAEPGLWFLPRVSSCVSCRARSLIIGAPAPPVPGILTTVATLCWHQWVSPLPSSLHILVLLFFSYQPTLGTQLWPLKPNYHVCFLNHHWFCSDKSFVIQLRHCPTNTLRVEIFNKSVKAHRGRGRRNISS